MIEDKIIELWQDGSSKHSPVERVVEDMPIDNFKRKSHGYERSQCRTTHKRQDC